MATLHTAKPIFDCKLKIFIIFFYVIASTAEAILTRNRLLRRPSDAFGAPRNDTNFY